MQAAQVMTKKELCNLFGFRSYKGLYSLLVRVGFDLPKGQHLFSPKEIKEIALKTGLEIDFNK